jgi:hypothetical protein
MRKGFAEEHIARAISKHVAACRPEGVKVMITLKRESAQALPSSFDLFPSCAYEAMT